MNNLKINLPRLMREKGISLTKLAAVSGVPKSTIHSWETQTAVNISQLKKVATVLNVSIHYLVFGEQDPCEAPMEELLKEIFTGDVRVTLHRIERKKR